MYDAISRAARAAHAGTAFNKAELRKAFAENAPAHVRQACIDASDNPQPVQSYPCSKHPTVRIPVHYRGDYSADGSCPQCVLSDKPLLTRFDDPDSTVCAVTHDVALSELAADRWTRASHRDVWPSWAAVKDSPPPWWPRDPLGAPTHTDCEPGLEEAYKALYAVRQGKRAGAFIYGSAGTGKTFAVCRLAARCWKDGLNVAIVSEQRLAAIASAAKSNKDQWAEWATPELRTIPLLVVDECGRANSWTGARGDWYEELLGYRYEHRAKGGHEGLRTVFSSNVPLDVLGESRGQTVKSRIRGICGPDIFVFGPDLRELRA